MFFFLSLIVFISLFFYFQILIGNLSLISISSLLFVSTCFWNFLGFYIFCCICFVLFSIVYFCFALALNCKFVLGLFCIFYLFNHIHQPLVAITFIVYWFFWFIVFIIMHWLIEYWKFQYTSLIYFNLIFYSILNQLFFWGFWLLVWLDWMKYFF